MSDLAPLPTTTRLLELVDRMGDRKVIMLVDLVADRFVTGMPKRISREAPVLILSFVSESFRLGGGANAVANVAALGGKPMPLGIVGEDESGDQIIAALEELDVPTDGVLRRSRFRTPTKTRILGGGRHAVKQQVVRLDVEESLEMSGEEESQFRKTLERWKSEARVAVLSDYGYGAVSPSLLPPLRQALGQGGVLLGDSRYRLAQFAGLDASTPNEEEAEVLLGGSLGEDDATLSQSGKALLDRLGTRFALITRGSSGMVLFADKDHYRIPVHGTDQVADVTGAGDTVIGTFALALAAGGSPIEAALLANYAGGRVVMKMGTATLSRDELRAAIQSDPAPIEQTRWAKY